MSMAWVHLGDDTFPGGNSLVNIMFSGVNCRSLYSVRHTGLRGGLGSAQPDPSRRSMSMGLVLDRIQDKETPSDLAFQGSNSVKVGRIRIVRRDGPAGRALPCTCAAVESQIEQRLCGVLS